MVGDQSRVWEQVADTVQHAEFNATPTFERLLFDYGYCCFGDCCTFVAPNFHIGRREVVVS